MVPATQLREMQKPLFNVVPQSQSSMLACVCATCDPQAGFPPGKDGCLHVHVHVLWLSFRLCVFYVCRMQFLWRFICLPVRVFMCVCDCAHAYVSLHIFTYMYVCIVCVCMYTCK
jgi:hypothetical protein